MAPSETYRFGPFQLDVARKRLERDAEHLWLPDTQADVLALLVANAGKLIDTQTLTAAAWKDVAVTDDSIYQAIRKLRHTLGKQPNGEPYIETTVRRGYRFVASVERVASAVAPISLDDMLAPYEALVTGRAALETMDRDAVERAREAFTEALQRAPAYAPAHIGLANVRFLTFESTRATLQPAWEELHEAATHAEHACRLKATSGDAWSTLALIRQRLGASSTAIAAARKAIDLEPDDWRHHLRLAYVSWGQQRLTAAQAALTLSPGLPLGHWFAATVFVARSTFDLALTELSAGCAAQAATGALDHGANPHAGGRFSAVGLHLLLGLVLAANGAIDAALEHLDDEVNNAEPGHVYARESCANAWYAIGALRLRQGLSDAAVHAFAQALAIMPGHPMATVGMVSAGASKQAVPSVITGLPQSGSTRSTIEEAVMSSAVLALEGKHEDAARRCTRALLDAEPGPAGWMLPVEPLLNPTAHRLEWAPALAALRARAV